MSIETEWDNEKQTILITKISGKWSLDDYREANAIITNMTEDIEHDFMYILDFTYSEGPPARFLSVGKDMRNNVHPKMQKIIFVKANRLIRAMIKIMRSVFPGRTAKLAYANSLEDARSIAKQTLDEDSTFS